MAVATLLAKIARRSLLLVAFLLTSILMASLGGAMAQTAPDEGSALDEPVAPDQIIVKYQEDVGAGVQADIRTEEGLDKQAELDLINAEVVTIEGQPVEEAISDLNDRPEVEYAEPDFKVYPAGYADEPLFGDLWGLHNTGQNGGIPDVDINALEASSITQGDPNVVVSVVDTGVDIGHPDLRDNIWTNPGESGVDGSGKDKATNGVDDDGNGKVDDVHGWDFVSNNASVYDPAPRTESGDEHGTHVAGTIASPVNDLGVVGVAPNVKIMPLKFIGPNGSGSISNAILAIEYAKSEGVKISNNSWGGSDYSQALKDTINKSGMLFVAAAGNGGSDDVGDDNDTTPFYPASFDSSNILSVAAVNNKGNLASFSNYGATSVDISAPGVNILSTLPLGKRSDLPAITLSSIGSVPGKALTAGFGVEEIGGGEADKVSFMSKAFSAVNRGTQSVILVDDDMSETGLPNVRPAISGAIQAATGSAPIVINVPPGEAGPGLARLRGNTVVWATGEASFSAKTDQGVATMETLRRFLVDGGKLVLTGRDALLGNENASFVTGTLGLKVQSNVYHLPEVNGSSGTDFTEESYRLNSDKADSYRHDVLTSAASAAVPLGIYIGPSWGSFGGTSMATPHATGAAALAASVRPALLGDPVALKKVVMDGGKPLPATYGKTVTGDMVDAAAAADAIPPDAPTLDLETGSDTGSSADDDITNINKPTFVGEAETNSTVRLYEDDKLLGEDKADDAKKWSITVSEALDDGEHTVAANAKDAVGNVSLSPDPRLTVTIDTVVPSIKDEGPTTQPNANGWYKSDVTNSFSASDELSGLAAPEQGSFQKSTQGEGTGVKVASGTVADKAGNVADSIYSQGFQIDKTSPVLNVATPDDGAVVELSDGIPAPSFAPADEPSSIASGIDFKTDELSTPQTASGVGTYTYRAQATDMAGNTSTEIRSFTVVYGAAYGGIRQPINASGTSNFKLGSTVPVKFQILLPNGTPIDNAVASLRVQRVDIVPNGDINEAVSTAASTTSNLFRYDDTSAQYIFNLSTKDGYINPNGETVAFEQGTWKVIARLDDGTTRSATFDLRR